MRNFIWKPYLQMVSALNGFMAELQCLDDYHTWQLIEATLIKQDHFLKNHQSLQSRKNSNFTNHSSILLINLLK